MSPLRSRHVVAAVSLLALAAALLFGAVASAYATQSIGLSSASFDFTANPGQDAKGEVFLSNQGNETVNVLVYAADQKVDNKGKLSYVTPNRDTTNFLDSPASWVQLKLPGNAKTLGNTPYVVLKPQERIPVTFLVQVPQGAVPGDKQIMLFFEITDLNQKQTGVTSRVSGRLGARIAARVAGEFVEQVDIRPFVVGGFATGDKIDYSFTVINGGNVDKRFTAPIAILDRNETARTEGKALNDELVFAGKSLEKSGSLSLAGLAPGQYTVRLEAKYAREAQGVPPGEIVKTRTFWFVPLWLIITVGAILLVILLGIVWWISASVSKRKALKATAEAPATQAAAAQAQVEQEPQQDQAAGS